LAFFNLPWLLDLRDGMKARTQAGRLGETSFPADTRVLLAEALEFKKMVWHFSTCPPFRWLLDLHEGKMHAGGQASWDRCFPCTHASFC
jgi:hypothetical protein